MKYKVYVDGQEGTTGLKIFERLDKRDDLEILKIDSDKRKDLSERKKFINSADIVFLCLPDDASREAVTLLENSKTKIIDASTAFRTDDNWVYGIPELTGMRTKISNAKKVSNPGCHATGFIMLLKPLIEKGLISNDALISATSVTGYSGGGKKLIEKYQNKDNFNRVSPPLHYALNLNHKHLKEMQKISGSNHTPIFTPILGNFYNGMVVSIPIHKISFEKNINPTDIHSLYKEYYNNQKFVKIMDLDFDKYLDEGCLPPTTCNETNNIELFVFGNEDRLLLSARFDNLGKGASGAAIQNMNIMLGLNEFSGLI
ncbi:MAG TPA: N-acetyl-gamma-glutamyl-phosphate reductase [Spirochaetota bacterium]|nr:N-acetyl-gamma-glutamyl-phosphate reductase [Spirochaetota bacterium]